MLTVKLVSDTVRLIPYGSGEMCFEVYYDDDHSSPPIAKVKIGITPTIGYKEFAWNPQFSDCDWFMGEVHKQIVKVVNERKRKLRIEEWEMLNGRPFLYTEEGF